MNKSDVACVLGLIATCSSNLSLHLITYGDYNHDDFERFRSFFRRSQLTALRIEMKGSGTWFDLVEESVDHLETLTLEGCSIWDRPLQDFIEALDDPDTSDAPITWPKLHALYLKDCWTHKPLLLNLLSLHKIKYFELIDRRKPQGRYPSPNHFALEALEEAVREIVGSAHCLGEFLYFKDGPDMSYLETRELGLM
ncbi:hypothetical protein BDV93DRAFT_563393 [Ceratobasidium sp. AG-I]|nr:hypothetical protein BDV93DRAFT_563393 [Ceratobasidium sp. AG-I]